MSDFIQRFKERKVVSAEVTFNFKGFEFRVARFAQDEINEARRAARAILRGEGNEQPNETESFIAYLVALGPIIARHVKGWKHDASDPVQFTKANLDLLFKSMDEIELLEFSHAFNEACSADAQKKTDSPPSGSISAEGASNTKSNGPTQPAEPA